MAKVHSIVQGLAPNNDHESEVIKLISSPWAKNIIISVAFVAESGVSKIEKNLINNNKFVTIFAGISNGVTTKQALSRLLKTGIKIYAIDIGTQQFIYHPKIYAAIGDQKALAIVGSANLTSRGLRDNIEISSKLELDLNCTDDKFYIDSIIKPFDKLIKDHPINVFKISSQNEIDDLFNQGRLEDESVIRKAKITGVISSNSKSVSVPTLPTYKRKSSNSKFRSSHIKPVTNITSGWLWSKKLSGRDLGNPKPKSQTTNATAELGMSQGSLVRKIDQRTYFRNVVFSNLSWKNNGNNKYSSNANFEIIISGICWGVYNLKIIHDANYNTKSSKQSNIHTKIKWGPLSSSIKNPNLLNKIINLYYLGSNKYQLEIV